VHGVSVVHGDLTPVRWDISEPFFCISQPFSQNNVLLDGDNRAVLTDFGLSSKLVDQGHTYLQRSCAQPGAVRYAAPELLCSNEPIQPDTRSDVYSFGCLALQVGFQCLRSCLGVDGSLQVLSGHMPWADVEYERIVMFKVINGETPQRPDKSQISDAHWHLIQPCLSRLGATPPRPSTSEILTFLGKELQSEGIISLTGD
jgi:serine/threonine protein kinase